MQITFQNIPHQIFQNTKPIQLKTPHLLQQIPCDTVSFTGHWDLLKLSDKTIFQKINETRSNNKNLLGEGGQAKVYRIPNSNYCARFEKHEFNDYNPTLNRNIYACDKINHVVAKFGKYSSIMHYIEGVPVFSPNTPACNAQKTAQDIAEMPITTFKKLVQQICYAYDNGMMFDCAWGNVIVNPKENKLTAIDFNKNILDESLKPLSYTFSSLVHKYTTPEQIKIYANKILNAVLEEFQPSHKPFWNVTNFDFSSLLAAVEHSSDFGKTPQSKLLYKYLEVLKELKVKDLQGIDVSRNLNGTLKIVKALINQTL